MPGSTGSSALSSRTLLDSRQLPASARVGMDGVREADLVRRSLEGDAEAYGELVQTHQRVLYNVALRMTGNREDAQDVTQIAFIKAYQKLASFDRSRKFFSWVYRILWNETLNLVQRRPRHEPLDEETPAGQPSPELESEERQESVLIHEAIQELPADYRQVILLRHFAQLSYQEMSRVIELPEKTVKSRLFTARRLLGTILERKGVALA
jgi:RNA polymerase sigma-70 factor (ECF subfamily)